MDVNAVRAVLIALALTGATPTAALACTPPPGVDSAEWQSQRDAEHLAATTSVYLGVLESIVENPNGSLVSFSVRKTEDVWGDPGPASLDLEFMAGSCSWYLPFMEGWPEGSAPAPGTVVAVFATPNSLVETHEIYLVTGSEFEAYMDALRALHPN